MRRKSLAKYRIAASANSPRDALKTPLPFVSVTSLATSSGKSVRSSPTEREWIQRKFGHIRNTSRMRGREPDQLNRTSASGAAFFSWAAELPITTLATSDNSRSIGSCGSCDSESTRTEIVLLDMRGEFTLRSIVCGLLGSSHGADKREQCVIQFVVSEFAEFYVAEESPALHVFHGPAGEHLGHWPERFHFEKVVVGERFKGAPKIRIRLRRIGLGAFDERITAQKVSSPSIRIE